MLPSTLTERGRCHRPILNLLACLLRRRRQVVHKLLAAKFCYRNGVFGKIMFPGRWSLILRRAHERSFTAKLLFRGRQYFDSRDIRLSTGRIQVNLRSVSYSSAAGSTAGASTASLKPHSLTGQTFSVPRRLVVFRVNSGQAHLGQGSLSGGFHTA